MNGQRVLLEMLLTGIVFGLCFSGGEISAAPLTIYVAPDGNAANPGTKEKPLATPQQARDAVRKLKGEQGGTLQQPVTVLLRGGTYFLSAPLIFTAEDSGSAECPVTYAAVAGEKPIFSGGRRLKGWKEVTVGNRRLWAVEIPEVKAGQWYFHQLWVNGRRRMRARHPNNGFLRIAALPDVKANTHYQEGQQRFQYAPGDFQAWDNLADVEAVVFHLWTDSHLSVAGIDAEKRVISFAAKSRFRMTDGQELGELSRYYVENAFELLDAPGEWYLNRKTGTLYYWPLPAEKISEAVAIAPVLKLLMHFEGEPKTKQFIDHLIFRGLTFMHSEWWPARDQVSDAQAASNVPAAIQGDGITHCTFEGCTVAHNSTYAFHLARGCNNNQITRCELHDLGAGGVKIGEQNMREVAEEQTHANAILDCHLHDGDQVFHQAVGVWIGQSYDNRVAHNHIHDFYYTGISVGWTWGHGKTLARNNIIEFNHLHDLGKGWLSDLGGVYTLGVQPGTVIRSNVFHDITASNYGGWGIYFDEGSSGIVAENNLVYRTTHGGFHHNSGKENVVRNNIFALGRDAQIQNNRVEPHRSFTFERNLVFWKKGKLLEGQWDGRDQFAFDHNLYWCPDVRNIRFADLSWEDWRKRNLDAHSVVADPLFVDPDKGDFRLDPKSPALELGFVPPDLSRVGPRPATP